MAVMKHSACVNGVIRIANWRGEYSGITYLLVLIHVLKRAVEDRKVAEKSLSGHQPWRTKEIRWKTRISQKILSYCLFRPKNRLIYIRFMKFARKKQ